MADWPTFSDEDRGGRTGVNLVGLEIHKLLKWVFRETSSSDLGIDGEIEVRNPDKTSHGRIIHAQIKCGKSFLQEGTPTGYVYRGSLKHLRYWLNHTGYNTRDCCALRSIIRSVLVASHRPKTKSQPARKWMGNTTGVISG